MNCPSDATTLLMSERQGIEIDYCPQCRGVWLDRGELDKILERAQAEAEAFSASATPAAPVQPAQQARPSYTPQEYSERPRYDERRDSQHSDRRGGSYDPRYDSRRKKKSPFEFLGDLFE